jgi:hypothetical protein
MFLKCSLSTTLNCFHMPLKRSFVFTSSKGVSKILLSYCTDTALTPYSCSSLLLAEAQILHPIYAPRPTVQILHLCANTYALRLSTLSKCSNTYYTKCSNTDAPPPATRRFAAGCVSSIVSTRRPSSSLLLAKR